MSRKTASHGRNALAARPSPTRKPLSARFLALRVLEAVDRGLTVQGALAGCRDFSLLSPRDRHLCTDLVYGSLRTQRFLRALARQFLRQPDKLPVAMQRILDLALYSLCFQDRVPAHAAIHDAVRQVSSLFGTRMGGVANGVLRSAQRAMTDQECCGMSLAGSACHDDNSLPDDGSAWAGLALRYSLPDWLVSHWRDSYGDRYALMLMRRAFSRPYTALRVNASHSECQRLVQCLRALPGAVAVGRTGIAFAPGCMPHEFEGCSLERLVRDGALSFQAAGSQCVLEELELAAWREPVWDACAGFGGKSLYLLECGVPVSLCSDLSQERLAHLPAQCARLGLRTPVLCLMDAARPAIQRWDGHILLDVPCSGLGVLGRRPDICLDNRRSEASLPVYPSLQQRLLRRALCLLRPGKCVAYITCTLNPAENELLVAQTLAQAPQYTLVRQWQTPHDHAWMEGMYGALVMRR